MDMERIRRSLTGIFGFRFSKLEESRTGKYKNVGTFSSSGPGYGSTHKETAVVASKAHFYFEAPYKNICNISILDYAWQFESK